MVQLLEFCQRTPFDWSQCWGFSDCYTLMDFISSIRIDQGLLLSCCFFFFPLFTTMNSLCFSCFSFINNILFLLIKKEKRKKGSVYLCNIVLCFLVLYMFQYIYIYMYIFIYDRTIRYGFLRYKASSLSANQFPTVDSEVSDINGRDAVRVEGIMAQASDKGSE